MIRRLLDWVGWVPAPRVPTLEDRAWALADRAAVLRRDSLRGGLDDFTRARLRHDADTLDAMAAHRFAVSDARKGRAS